MHVVAREYRAFILLRHAPWCILFYSRDLFLILCHGQIVEAPRNRMHILEIYRSGHNMLLNHMRNNCENCSRVNRVYKIHYRTHLF